MVLVYDNGSSTAFLAPDPTPALRWGIGAVIDRYPRTSSGGYEPAAFRAALGGLLAAQAAALAWLLLLAACERAQPDAGAV